MLCIIALALFFPWKRVFRSTTTTASPAAAVSNLLTNPPTLLPPPVVAPVTGSTTNLEILHSSTTNRTIERVVTVTNETTVLMPSPTGPNVPAFSVNISGTNAVTVQTGGQFIVGGIINVDMPGGGRMQGNRPDSLYVPVAIGQSRVFIPHGKSAIMYPQGTPVDYEPKLPQLKMMLDGLTAAERPHSSPYVVTIHNSGAGMEVNLKWGE